MKKQCEVKAFISFDDVKDGELISFKNEPNKAYLKLADKYYEINLRTPLHPADLGGKEIYAIFNSKNGQPRIRKVQ